MYWIYRSLKFMIDQGLQRLPVSVHLELLSAELPSSIVRDLRGAKIHALQEDVSLKLGRFEGRRVPGS